ncbi:unnamed protein product [Heterobilharzia americana]|nr:unnamed protein product [Heterobilharzia americana]
MNVLLFGIKLAIACRFVKAESETYEANLDEPYYDEVSQKQKIEYHFTLSNRSEFVIRIHLANYNPRLDYPILVVIKQVNNVMSFQVPVVLNTIPAYGNVSRTLCPIAVPFGEVRKLTVELSNAISSPQKVRYMFLAELVRDFDLKSGTEKSMLVSPAEPVYLRYVYPPDKNSAEIKIVSESDICMVLSIQKLQCPVSDLFDNVGNTGLRQTVTTLGAVSADITQFPKGFFVVLVLKPTDYACFGIENIIPFPDPHGRQIYPAGSRTKSVRIIVTSTPRKWPYLLPILGAIGVYLLFYVVTIILIILYQRAGNRKRFYNVSYDNPVVYSPSKTPLESIKKENKFSKHKKTPNTTNPPTVSRISSNSLNIFRPSHTGIHHQILSLPQDYQSITLTNSVESNLYCRTSSTHQTPLAETQGFHGWFSSTDEDDDAGSNEIESKKQKKYFTGTASSDRRIIPANLAYSKMIGQETTSVSHQPIAMSSSDNIHNCNNSNNNARNQRNSYDNASTSLTDEPADIGSEFTPMYKMDVLLYVSDLSRKRYGTLNRKYLLYFWYLIIISIFYGLPAVQLIMTYQKAVFETGNEDLCYYNFECAHSLGIFTAFNNIISNIGYVMLGLLFLGLTARRDILHRRMKNLNPNSQVLGIPQHYGLFYAMGLALTMEGLMSACYHMCPSFSNFQFDTAYMYILAMLIMLKIYQTRHPDVNASAHSAYMVMAVVIFLGVLGVLYGNQVFWIIFTIFFLIMSVVLTVEIYYMGQWNIDLCLPRRIYHLIRTDGIGCFRPTYLERMVLLLIANLVNFTLAGYGIVRRPRDFSTFLLSIFMINLLMYTFFYVIMKLRHRERFQMLSLVYILLACVSWGCAIYFYLTRTTTWEVTPARSRALNQPCVLLDFYDAHDVWHFLSSISMFFSFMLLMYLDDDLSKRPRNQIFVF